MEQDSQSPASTTTLQMLVQQLSTAVTYAEPTNVDTNRKLWNNYAKDWGTDVDWVKKMTSNLQLPEGTTMEDQLEFLGDEWSDKQSVVTVLDDYIFPHITEDSIIAEIGSGGGRIACKVAPRVKELTCFDISDEMLKKARKSLAARGLADKSKFALLPDSRLPPQYSSHFDFIYVFDCFPHVDLHTQWKYYKDIKRALKPGGKALIHTASLETEQGWARFEKQEKYTVGGFYFMVPSEVRTLIKRAGFTLLKESTEVTENGKKQTGNLYYDRDYLALVENPK
eukprot:TRINITY_DN12381_c0_g1_i1.p1 TRINITY_DN12381_c0_g1~~TRINITY_DN12381_c0_g1_i1.p1  ORF type:complete len:326 (+),score=47.90 TRINITY_DN12381_c0_g1_i1:133-978(+)